MGFGRREIRLYTDGAHFRFRNEYAHGLRQASWREGRQESDLAHESRRGRATKMSSWIFCLIFRHVTTPDFFLSLPFSFLKQSNGTASHPLTCTRESVNVSAMLIMKGLANWPFLAPLEIWVIR